MPRGRVRTLDDAKQREVCALMSAGCSLQAAAEYIECAPNTIRREAARNPQFNQRFREARLQAQLSPLSAMRKAAADHWRAAAWMLERTDPEHFGRRPAPAFRPKQAKALKSDILDILNAEIENPFLLNRLTKQIQQLMEYSIDGVVNVERCNQDLRGVLSAIERLVETTGQAAFDRVHGQPQSKPPSSPPATSTPTATSPPTTTPAPNTTATPSASPTAPATKAATTNGSPNAKSNPNGSNGASSATGTSKNGRTNPPPPQELDSETANTTVTWGDMTKVLQRLNKGAAKDNGSPAGDSPAADSAAGTPADVPTTKSQPAKEHAPTAQRNGARSMNKACSSNPDP